MQGDGSIVFADYARSFPMRNGTDGIDGTLTEKDRTLSPILGGGYLSKSCRVKRVATETAATAGAMTGPALDSGAPDIRLTFRPSIAVARPLIESSDFARALWIAACAIAA